MSDLADCFAATAAWPDGLAPRNKLAAEFEPSHRSDYSAETDDQSLVIGEPELANPTKTRLGPISGHCALYFQGFHTDGSSGFVLQSTQRLEVTLSK